MVGGVKIEPGIVLFSTRREMLSLGGGWLHRLLRTTKMAAGKTTNVLTGNRNFSEFCPAEICGMLSCSSGIVFSSLYC